MDIQVIHNRVFEVRGCQVMTDFHLVAIYGVETIVLKQAVRRNIERFPDDFMIKLTKDEAKCLIDIGVSRFVIPLDYNVGTSLPFVFTEIYQTLLEFSEQKQLDNLPRNPIGFKIYPPTENNQK
jgi:hypothetical protein